MAPVAPAPLAAVAVAPIVPPKDLAPVVVPAPQVTPVQTPPAHILSQQQKEAKN